MIDECNRFLFISGSSFRVIFKFIEQLTSFSRVCHASLSLGPAFVVKNGIFWTVARVVGSHESAMTVAEPPLVSR